MIYLLTLKTKIRSPQAADFFYRPSGCARLSDPQTAN